MDEGNRIVHLKQKNVIPGGGNFLKEVSITQWHPGPVEHKMEKKNNTGLWNS